MNIIDFCNKHHACKDDEEWAVTNCQTMQDAWDKAGCYWLIWIATQPGVLTDKELRLFAVWSVRQVESLLTDQRSKNALEVAERHANGNATDEELAVACAGARDAARNAARNAARDAQADYLRQNTTPNFEQP